MDIRHIKITSTEGLYRINEKKAFKGLIVSLASGPNMMTLTRKNTETALYVLRVTSLPPLKPHLTSVRHISHALVLLPLSLLLLSVLGVDSVLPAELFEGVLQGRGHHAAHALQTTRAKHLA